MNLVNNHAFAFYSVGHFCPISVFSRIEFELQPYEHFIAMSKLFNLSTITDKLTRCPELQKSFKNMVSMCHDPRIDLSFALSKANETSTFKKIANNVLSKLGNVVMETNKVMETLMKMMYTNLLVTDLLVADLLMFILIG